MSERRRSTTEGRREDGAKGYPVAVAAAVAPQFTIIAAAAAASIVAAYDEGIRGGEGEGGKEGVRLREEREAPSSSSHPPAFSLFHRRRGIGKSTRNICKLLGNVSSVSCSMNEPF